MATEYQLDQIAEHFKKRDEPSVSLADVLGDLGIENLELRDSAISAAMAVRGLFYENGRIIKIGHAQPLMPAKPDYAPFLRAAREIIDMATYPVPISEMLSMTGLASEAIPASGFVNHLKSKGLHFLPGAGYWKYPNYVNDNGTLIYTMPDGNVSRRMMEVLDKHGWPISGEDFERITGGVVTSRYVTKNSVRKTHSYVRGIGCALFVPRGADATPNRPIPMTQAVADEILELPEGYLLFRSENVRLYKLAQVLTRHRFAKVRHFIKVRDGVRQRALSMELTEAGKLSLKGLSRKSKADAF